MKYDDILKNYVGEFGNYQKLQYFLVVFPTLFVSMQVVSWTFTGTTPGHRCMTNAEFENKTLLTPMFDTYSPKEYNLTKKEPYESNKLLLGCSHVPEYEPVYENYSTSDLQSLGCNHGFVFDKSDVKYSAIERWELICDWSFAKATIQAMYYVGQAAGSLVFGFISDKLGRKLAFVLAILMQCISGLLMAFVPYWWMFGLLRLVVGFGHPGVFVISVVIGMELVGPSKRYIGSIATGIFFGFGQILLGLLAYGIRDYRYLQLTISVPYFAFLSYWFFVPESARWLLSMGKVEQATGILRKAAKANGRTLPDDWHEHLDDRQPGAEKKETRVYGFRDIFRYPNMRRRACVEFFCWPAVSMVYYGLGMNPSFLGGNRYIVFILAGLAELPACLLAAAFLNRWGRKILAVTGFTVGGLLLIATLLVPESDDENDVTPRYVMSGLVIIAKLFITMEYAVQYCYSPELFPTVIRAKAAGLCSMFARIGGVAASYISMYLVIYSKTAVVLCFSLVAFVAAGLTLLLPETSGAPMLETMEDAEKFGKNARIWSFKPPIMKDEESAMPLREDSSIKA